jgi:hypothetical protein
MQPNRNNYELWLIDYLDGALDKERTGLLISFLEENPDLKEELADLAPISLKQVPGKFKNRENLKKVAADMDNKQFELLCVADIENDLDTDNKRDLEELLSSDPEKRRTFDIFRKAKLNAPSVTFRYKQRLKKLTAGERIFRYTFTLVSTAAAILIIIMVLKKPVQLPENGNIAVNSITNPVISATTSQKHDAEKAGPVTGLVRKAVALNTVSAVKMVRSDEIIQLESVSEAKDRSSNEKVKNDIVKIAGSEEFFKRPDTGVKLAEINISEVSGATDTEGNGPGQLIENLFREKVIKAKKSEKVPLNAYDVADAGVKGLKKLFGWNITLQKRRDEKGDVKSVSFSSKLFSFNAPVKKPTPAP